MKRSFLKIAQLALFTFALSLFFVSCEKESLDIVDKEPETEEEVTDPIEEVEAPTDFVMAITIGNSTMEYDAFATYCEGEDGVMYLSVSNNAALLDTVILSDAFQLNDFLLYFANDGNEVASLGGAAFEETLAGEPIVSVIFDAEAAEITITEANAQFVQGTMTGIFELLSGDQVDYSVEFTAEVVSVFPFCN
jgi:hypothetical protein